MNKVGISTATFFTKVLTEDCFALIKLMGGECAEVFLTTNSEYSEEFGKLLVERQQETGLDIYSVHALNTQFEPQLFNPAQRTVNDALVPFKNVLARAKDLGASAYSFHGQSRLKKGTQFNLEKVGKRLEELNQTAKEYGVTIGLENVQWALYNQPEVFDEIKKYAPTLGCVLDIKQAWRSERDWKEYIDIMGDRLLNVHLCDHTVEGKTCVVGQGVFDFKELISYLHKKGYTGPLMIEQYAADYKDFSEIEEAVKYLKKLVEDEYALKI